MSAITALPTPPNRSMSSSDFVTAADAFLAALPTLATEINTATVAMNNNATNSVSTTSLTVGSGTQNLTVETGKSYVVGQSLKIASTASPTNYMIGAVTAYTTGTGALVVSVTQFGGSGTIAAWTVTLAPSPIEGSISASVTFTGSAPITIPGTAGFVQNLKLVVNATVNKLDVFSKSGGAAFDATNILNVAIPDGTGNTFRTRAASYLSGAGQFTLANAISYWGRASSAVNTNYAYEYKIFDGTGIVFALAGYSGFESVPTTTTVTDDDYFLLEDGSTYTRNASHYCVCVGKIGYTYNTANTPDHTFLATVTQGPKIVWNPVSDYTVRATLATTLTQASDIVDYSAVSIVVKQSGKYQITGQLATLVTVANNVTVGRIKVGSATYGSAVLSAYAPQSTSLINADISCAVSSLAYLAAGDTAHLGAAVNAGGGNRTLYGDSTQTGMTYLIVERIS